MIRIGPARNTPAGGIAAILSCAGCGLCLFGGFLCLVGMILIGTSQDNPLNDPQWSDPFFDSSRKRRDDSNRVHQTAGVAVLCLGLIMAVCGIVCCVFMCKKANEYTRQQGTVMQQTVVGGPVVTGSVPTGPQYSSVPTAGPAYPPGYQPQYPMGQQYPPPATNPGYPPPQGVQYPPTAPVNQAYPPPATNPAYPLAYGYRYIFTADFKLGSGEAT